MIRLKVLATSLSPNEDDDKNLALCPSVSLQKGTTHLCWTCSILCCCIPLCYPCYLSKTLRERRQRKKLGISRNKGGGNRGKYEQTQGTCTMYSKQSTGTSGYGTLLSRKGTLVSVSPNLDTFFKVNKDVFSKLENTSRQSISAIFLATEVAESFLASCQYSELLQNFPVQKLSRTVDTDVENNTVEADVSKKVSGSSLDSLFSNSSYSFSQLHLHLTDDFLGQLEMSKLHQGGDKDIINVTSDFDQEGLFRYSGHVDVAENTMSVRVIATLEVSRENKNCKDPVVLANIYCRQLVKSNMVVLMMTEKDIAEFKRRGLLEYIRKYWAGYFSVLFVYIGSRIRVFEDHLIDTLGRVFGLVETIYLEDDSKIAGYVFSALARMGTRPAIRYE